MRSKLLYLFLSVIFLSGCTNEFSEVESDISDPDSRIYDALYRKDFSLKSKTVKTDIVQSNNLETVSFGIFNQDVFGKTKASLVSQALPVSFEIPYTVLDTASIKIESVKLYIPYFTTEDNGIIKIDSLYSNNPIKLSIYKNDYLIRDVNPESNDISERQKYYSNKTDGSNIISDDYLKKDILFLEENFKFTDSIHKVSEDISLKPGVYIESTNKVYWKEFLKGLLENNIDNNTSFNNYFRGLYIETDEINEQGSMISVKLTDAFIDINYTVENTNENYSYILNFSGNNINFFESEDIGTSGEKVYLKGNNGYLSEIEIFNRDENGDSEELENLRDSNWLINEANIVLKVDQSTKNTDLPYRLFIYNSERNSTLIDYDLDVENTNRPALSKINHLKPLQETDEGAKLYKIRITEHIKGLLRGNNNDKLIISVSSNVNIDKNEVKYDILNFEEYNTPESSVTYPKGVVLDKEDIYLEMYYSELNK